MRRRGGRRARPGNSPVRRKRRRSQGWCRPLGFGPRHRQSQLSQQYCRSARSSPSQKPCARRTCYYKRSKFQLNRCISKRILGYFSRMITMMAMITMMMNHPDSPHRVMKLASRRFPLGRCHLPCTTRMMMMKHGELLRRETIKRVDTQLPQKLTATVFQRGSHNHFHIIFARYRFTNNKPLTLAALYQGASCSFIIQGVAERPTVWRLGTARASGTTS